MDRDYEGSAIDATMTYLSEIEVPEEGEVEVPGEDAEGVETTETWPDAATDRDDLNDDQIAVIEAAIDPSRDWDSLCALSREVVPHRHRNYANKTLNRHHPAAHEAIKMEDRNKPSSAHESGADRSRDGRTETVDLIERVEFEMSAERAESLVGWLRDVAKYYAIADDPEAAEVVETAEMVEDSVFGGEA
ncbi:hypothetical protein Z052_01795 [Halorubrum sp. C191]|uniref:hypothetical protein n=1 Tax=Halorubrum sp. C191 TaxID=1383842 RepID=UPI000C079822|nr:hypothetical protein [Halorubrum sp. C191]PHQ43895.1 hypothetical protein Z052_01795 [Halorubrum sp. C191]